MISTYTPTVGSVEMKWPDQDRLTPGPEYPVMSEFIVSIWPLAGSPKDLQRYRGLETFQLRAVPRGEYELIEVRDTYTWQYDWRSRSESEGVRMMHVPVSALKRAESLVRHWTSLHLANGGSPGIAVVPSGVRIPDLEGKKHTDPGFEDFAALLKRLADQQTVCFRGLVAQANDLETKGKATEIQELHRSAAYWLMGDAAKALKWYKAITQDVLKEKKCVGCGEAINMEATRCKHCSLDLIEWYKRYDPNFVSGVDVAVQQYLLGRQRVNTTIAEMPSPFEIKPKASEPKEDMVGEAPEPVHEFQPSEPAPDYSATGGPLPQLNAKGELIESTVRTAQTKWAVQQARKYQGTSASHWLVKLAKGEITDIRE